LDAFGTAIDFFIGCNSYVELCLTFENIKIVDTLMACNFGFQLPQSKKIIWFCTTNRRLLLKKILSLQNVSWTVQHISKVCFRPAGCVEEMSNVSDIFRHEET
jgi:hypothetical protein